VQRLKPIRRKSFYQLFSVLIEVSWISFSSLLSLLAADVRNWTCRRS